MAATTQARSAVADVRSTPAFRGLARAGYAVNGLLNLILGAIAISVAVGAGSTGDASQSGAIAQLLQIPFGIVLVVVVIIGAAALGLWYLTEALFDRDPDAEDRWAHRVKHVGKGVAYLAIAAIGVSVLMQGGSSGSDSEESLTAQMLASPGGIVVIVIVGLVALGVGGYLVAKGARKKFRDDIRVPSGSAGTATVALGMVGYIARGIAITIIGILFLVAAFTHDAEAAGGMDDALATLAGLPFGQVLLIVIGLGFFAYALYSFVRARRAKL